MKHSLYMPEVLNNLCRDSYYEMQIFLHLMPTLNAYEIKNECTATLKKIVYTSGQL